MFNSSAMACRKLFAFLAPLFVQTIQCSDGQMSRLVNGSNLYSGRVEIGVYASQTEIIWGAVSDIGFGTREANVLCRSLGYSDGIVHRDAFYGRGTGTIWYIRCDGNEYSLWQCYHEKCISSCFHDFDVGVECNGTSTFRLRLGIDRFCGTVEMYHNHEWGTICNNDLFYRVNNAEVMCRSLGLSGGTIWNRKNSSHVNDTMPIWMNNVQCMGSEFSITYCSYDVTTKCTHADDMAIWCSPPLGCRECMHMLSCDQATNVCTCERGWTGELCDQDINECSDPTNYYCPLNTTCRNTNGSYFCLRTEVEVKVEVKTLDKELVPLILVACTTGLTIICLVVTLIIRHRMWTRKEIQYKQFGQAPTDEAAENDDNVGSSGIDAQQTNTEPRRVGMAGPMLRVQAREMTGSLVTTETGYGEAPNNTIDGGNINSHTQVKQIH